jgi:phospholipase C
MTQRSIFQQLTETGHTWKDYIVDTSIEDALWYTWTYSSGNTGLVQDMNNFYADAKAGNLPDFTFINPSCCSVGTNSMHPSGLISDGETIIKDVYEALRAGPQWNNTLFVITFDETGGFHDHVPPPLAVRPDDLTYTETTPTGQSYIFEFDRLGGRLPTWLISPWVSAGHVEQLGTNSAGQSVSYNAASVLRTLGYLWDFEPFTPRVQAAPSFDNLISTCQRKTVETLPDVVVWQTA